MKKLLLFLSAIIPLSAYCQFEFHNRGSQVYAQKGALIVVQGAFVNDSSIGAVKNDGTIEVQGDFVNSNGASFTVNTDNTSKDRAVKFTGTGTQAIKGLMNTAGTASFYNLVVDKATSTSLVQMQADATIEGSLVFGTSTITSTSNPSNFYTNNNQKGLFATYVDTNEYVLNVLNGNVDAISGYPALVMSGAPSTGYILTSGIKGSGNGGLQRKISSATDYDYPLGTVAHGFNAVKMNFTTIPSGGGLVKGKFNDGSDNPNGAIGTIGMACFGCTTNNPNPDNTGYNRFFESNPCNNDAAQWLVIDNASIKNHGYWSFATSTNNYGYLYSVEAFPNSFSLLGNISDTWRTLRYIAPFGYNPSGASNNWSAFIDSVTSVDDLMTYTKNTGTCYTGSGIPGGSYNGFGHLALGKSISNNALPVTMLYLTAKAEKESIVLDWATAVEINNSGFEVARSTEGTNFTKIGWVPGHNTTTEEQVYSYTDNDVLPNVVYYYRLRQVDNNGHSDQSKVVSAEVTGTTTSFTIGELTPNPAVNNTRIVANSVSQEEISAKVYIYNMEGKLMMNQLYTLNPGPNNIMLDLTTLTTGSYSVTVKAAGNSYSKILVVNK